MLAGDPKDPGDLLDEDLQKACDRLLAGEEPPPVTHADAIRIAREVVRRRDPDPFPTSEFRGLAEALTWKLKEIRQDVPPRTSATTSRPVPPYDLGRSPSARPLGLPMCQNRWAVPTWSYAMEIRPPARVVEIGTYSGGLTCALAVHASQIGARVVSYDRNLPDQRLRPLAAHLGVEFRTGDVWDLVPEIGQLVAGSGVSFVLCDGGDKRRELRTFARYLKPGDVVAAHDYACDDGTGDENRWWGWGEIRKQDGDAVAAEFGLRPWLQDHFDTAAWICYERPA